jgi:2-dehydro-3-deoxy-D-arabinonate dehydratase
MSDPKKACLMQLARYLNERNQPAIGEVRGEALIGLDPSATLENIFAAHDPAEFALSLSTGESRLLNTVSLLPPIEKQEVWAAGVTYKRSQTARMEESAAAASCYDRVYESARPELFFKATPHRVRGTGQDLFIRADSSWNVPEPEIALVLNARLDVVGFTIGNDMSSRDIEGENPLYLPQAKVYDACCGLGPWITLAAAMPDRAAMEVDLSIVRAGTNVFDGHTSGDRMAREFTDLIEYLGRDNSFPNGVILLTGTGIVPASDFTLEVGDEIRIRITGIGTLVNRVALRG